MEEIELQHILEKSQWTTAKTAVKNPHAYSLRWQWRDDRKFDQCVQEIRTRGKHTTFWGKPYTVYDLNGFRYWTMGWPIDETTLINRRPLTPEDAQ